MRKALARQRLVACTLFAALAFNAPLLWLFDTAVAMFGVPLVFLYVFGIWAAVIAVLAWVVEVGHR
ncbi:hypothetical protein [Denitromonas sp.]|uniref:hypothetical protein n=1 Tax=Denitromonas sp. TaxID=2734609 RepID=UPI003A83D38F